MLYQLSYVGLCDAGEGSGQPIELVICFHLASEAGQLSYVGIPFRMLEERGTGPIVWGPRGFGKGFPAVVLQGKPRGARIGPCSPKQPSSSGGSTS